MSANKVRVFLNHASEDKPLVRKLYHELKKESWIKPWLDEEEILPGQDWEYEINKALEDSDAVIICLSRKSVAKVGVVQAEIHKAQDLQKRRPEGQVFMIPVLLEKCEVPSKLSSFHWVDVSIAGNISKIKNSLKRIKQPDHNPTKGSYEAEEKEAHLEPSAPMQPQRPLKKRSSARGGLQIGGNVQITQGDLITGDKNISVGRGGAYVGGNVHNSNIITGNHDMVVNATAASEAFFEELLKRIDQRPNTSPDDREDLKANVAELKAEAEKGDEADESFLSRRVRNIKRIAPDIAEVLLATLVNPAAGFAAVVRKLAERLSKPATF